MRHAPRLKPQIHISQEGLEKARELGRQLLPLNISYVLTSTLHRSIQTAVAMGFAVSESNESLDTNSTVDDWMVRASGALGFFEVSKATPPLADYCYLQAETLKRVS